MGQESSQVESGGEGAGHALTGTEERVGSGDLGMASGGRRSKLFEQIVLGKQKPWKGTG